MSDHRIFLEMATACIDGLTHDERVAIDPAAFTRVLQICASVAGGRVPPVRSGAGELPVPPPMAFIRAYLLRPGDFVWGAVAAAFCVVDSILLEDTEWVYVTWRGGGTHAYAYQEPVHIALNREDAGDWNALRTEFDPDVVERLVATYPAGRRP